MLKRTVQLASSSGLSRAGLSLVARTRIDYVRSRPVARAFSNSSPALSGHNRWSKIRHRKGAADAAKGMVFTKVMSEIHAALRPPNSPDPILNAPLAAALAKAKETGVPKANVEAAFVRAKKLADGTGKNVVFEAMAPGGKVAFMVECVTDNTARTVSRVREIFTKFGNNMTTVAYLFERKGVVRVAPTTEGGATFDTLFDTALDGGAEDVREVEEEEGTQWEVITAPSDLNSLTQLLTSGDNGALYSLQSSELAYLANDLVGVDSSGEEGVNEEQAEKIMKCVDMMEGEADVVKVWTNLE